MPRFVDADQPALARAALGTDGQYGIHLGPGTADDTARINAALEEARLAGGGTVFGTPGETYRISAPLVQGSRVTFDMSRSYLEEKPGSNCNMIRNYSDVFPVAVADDAVTTVGSNVVTTSLAAVAQVGQTVYINGAGSNGYGELVADISAVNAGAGTITLRKLHGPPAKASAAVSGAHIQLSNRDVGIRIFLKDADRGDNGPNGAGSMPRSSNVAGHSLFLRGVDNYVVDIDRARAIKGISFVWPTNAYDGTVTIRDFHGERTALQPCGPIYRLNIVLVKGYTPDDLVNLCGNVYPDQTNTSGDVIGVTIGNLEGVPYAVGSTLHSIGSVLKLNAGQGNTVDAVKVTGQIGGSQTNGFPVWIMPDPAYPATTGGHYGTLDLGTIDFPNATVSPFRINSVNVDSVKAHVIGTTLNPILLRGNLTDPDQRVDYAEFTVDFKGAIGEGVKIMEQFTCGTLKLNVRNFRPTLASHNLVHSTDTPLIDHLIVTGEINPGINVDRIIRLDGGTFKKITVDGANFTFPDASNGHYPVVIDGTAAVGQLAFPNTRVKMGDSVLRTYSTTGSLGVVNFDGITTDANQRLANLSLLCEIQLGNARRVNATQDAFALASNLPFIFRGGQLLNEGGNDVIVSGANAASSRFFGPNLRVNVALIAKVSGTQAYNTNASLECGVGPVVCDGTNWKRPFLPGINAQTGTAYTLEVVDAERWVTLTNSSAITVTVPTHASRAFPIGTVIHCVQLGAGQVTFAGSGVTLLGAPGLKIAGQNRAVDLLKLDTNTWLLWGDLAA